MARTELQKLIKEVVAYQEECIAKARGLTNEQLDANFTVMRPSGPRPQVMRSVLYNLSIHPREHSVHLAKILQKTGSPLAQPTEAQAILAKAKESWGELEAVLACMDDNDLDREHEGHTPRNVLTHLRDAHKSYLESIEAGIKAIAK